MSTATSRGNLSEQENDSIHDKSYLRIKEAVALFGCPTELLVHHGAMGKLNLAIAVPEHMFVWIRNVISRETDIQIDYPELLILSRRDCINLELYGSVTINSFSMGYSVWDNPISIRNPYDELDAKDKGHWEYVLVYDRNKNPEGDIQDILVQPNDLFVLSREIRQLNHTAVERPEKSLVLPSSSHVSKSLSILNQAASRFWANADRDDRGTHPTNSEVVQWLTDNGFESKRTAEVGATIIRPEWAPTGRKKEE